MARRCASAAPALALLACLALALAPAAVDFVAPSSRAAPAAEGQALVRGHVLPERSADVSMASGGQPPAPGKINLLFLGLLAGTAVIGLLALFGYGAYSGAGSSL
mmetsp:Transcript_123474/g.335313  ORF Transcript_123474/g.335313 Transcript_123474/m.335313 type:complete len:105 (+) Transcript_123474:110-424(+)